MADEKPGQKPQPQPQQAVPIQPQQPQMVPRYINLAFVNHTGNEFSLDFVNLFTTMGGNAPNGQKPANIEGRFVMTPSHAKRLVQALTSNIIKYEAMYGPIQQAEEQKLPTGFTLN